MNGPPSGARESRGVRQQQRRLAEPPWAGQADVDTLDRGLVEPGQLGPPVDEALGCDRGLEREGPDEGHGRSLARLYCYCNTICMVKNNTDLHVHQACRLIGP